MKKKMDPLLLVRKLTNKILLRKTPTINRAVMKSSMIKIILVTKPTQMKKTQAAMSQIQLMT